MKIIRKKMKNIRLRVKNDGSVVLSVPYGVSETYIQQFLQEKSNWIQKHQSQVKPQLFINGETVQLFALAHTLHIVETSRKRARVFLNENNQIQMELPYDSDVKQREKLIHRFYAKQLSTIVQKMIEKYEPIMGVKVADVKYQHMQTRWGTCHITKHLIRLNTRLAMYSYEVIESVVVHEMVHLLEASHNQRFYQLMDLYFPRWRTYDQVLRDKK